MPPPGDDTDEVPLWLHPPTRDTAVAPRPGSIDIPIDDESERVRVAALEADPREEGDELGRPAWTAERWILLIGFGLIAVALGVIANQAWLVGIPDSWVWWASLAVVPPGLTALAALLGWRHRGQLAATATVITAVIALIALLQQPPLGLPQLVCVLAAVAVSIAARAAASPTGDPTPA